MAEKKVVLCEYPVDNRLCRSIIVGEEGKIVRKESCINKSKNTCCYLCPHQESCEIGCTYLVKPEDALSFNENIDQEIEQCKEKIESLSLRFAEGRISEQSYVNSVKALENRMDKLNKIKEKPLVSPNYFYRSEEAEGTLIEKPTALWYLVPFFFAILGGIVAYVGTRDRDKKMAETLLIFGILWSIFLPILVWIVIFLMASRL